jgi:glycosyltransferase involved in cell wall biosynthesis
VVIPVHNGEHHIRAALDSVARQAEGPTQILVVDDGSTDGTCSVVDAFADPRVRCVRQQRAGAAAARNHGARLAEGALIAFLDADDLWMDDKLLHQRRALEGGEADLVFGLVEEFVSPEDANTLAGRVRPHEGPMNGVSVITLLMRTADFHRVGPFDEQLQIGEFVDWYARAVDKGLTSTVIPRVLARRRLHHGNQGLANRPQASEYANVLKRILDRRREASS